MTVLKSSGRAICKKRPFADLERLGDCCGTVRRRQALTHIYGKSERWRSSVETKPTISFCFCWCYIFRRVQRLSIGCAKNHFRKAIRNGKTRTHQNYWRRRKVVITRLPHNIALTGSLISSFKSAFRRSLLPLLSIIRCARAARKAVAPGSFFKTL